MRRLIQKPKGVTYTQMAIWIDNHIYEPDCDYDTAYEYMYLLAYMLAAKHKYFNTQEEYEDFSTFLAYNVFQRYTADKYVNNGSKHLKSVLNYMKSILYFRKMAFNAQYRQKIIDPKFDNFDSDVYVEKQRAAYEASNREALVNGILDTFKRVPRMIKCCIPKVYCDDKSLEANLYMSSMLTIINRITLNNKCSTIFEEKANSSPKFDEVKYYSSHSTDNEVVAWHITRSMEPVVAVIVNKVLRMIAEEIDELSSDSTISDNYFNMVMGSGFDSRGASND